MGAIDHLSLSICGSQSQAATNWEAIILLWVVTPWLPEKRTNTHGQGTLQESPGFACQFLLASAVEGRVGHCGKSWECMSRHEFAYGFWHLLALLS